MKTLAGLLLLAGLFAAAGCGGEASDAASDAATFAVKRGDLPVRLRAQGTLEARFKVDIRPNIKTSAKILSIVDEGTVVKAGDVLVELDKAEVEKEIERLVDSVIQLETELKNARTEEDIQRRNNLSEIEKARLALEFAKLELKRYEEGDHPQQGRDLELAIERAESRLKQAEDKWSQMPRLLEAGFVTPVEVEEKELAFKEAKVEVESAKLDLELYRTYTHPMELRQRNSNVVEAERDLETAIAQAEARLDSKTAIVRQKERQYETAATKLNEARQELQNLTIRAPQPGIVIYGEQRRDNEEAVTVGATAFPGRTIIELPDLTRMNVEVQIHQADIGKVRKGQRAYVDIPGRRGGPLEGTVTDIGSVAQSRNWRDPVRRFEVVVQLDQEVEGLRAGVTANVEIEAGVIENVLHVPLQAAESSGGRYFVYVKEDGEPARRFVSFGRSNEQYVEVVEGLSEGEEVYLVNPEGAGGAPKGDEEKEGNGGSRAGRSPNGRGGANGAPAGGGANGGGGAGRGGR